MYPFLVSANFWGHLQRDSKYAKKALWLDAMNGENQPLITYELIEFEK